MLIDTHCHLYYDEIKKAIENAILDGEIENDYDQAWEFMLKLDLKSI